MSSNGTIGFGKQANEGGCDGALTMSSHESTSQEAEESVSPSYDEDLGRAVAMELDVCSVDGA